MPENEPEESFVTVVKMRFLTPEKHWDDEAAALTKEAWAKFSLAMDAAELALETELAPLGIKPDGCYYSYETT